ncbi:MAG: hypothetical protein AAF829_02640 [Pseudomonadota bacterium]
MVRQVFVQVAVILVLLTGCGGLIQSNSKAVFVLFDASGTYANNMGDAVRTSRVLAGRLSPNDWVGFAQISSCSFTDDSIVLRRKFSGVPSQASLEQQRVFEELNGYRDSFSATAYTDIRGALRFAASELQASDQAQHYIIVFSDLIEDVAPSCDTRDLQLDLTGVTIVATAVTKTAQDSSNPELYFERLDSWKRAVEDAGGTWVHAQSPDQLLAVMF